MRRFVFWTGMISLAAGMGVQLPGFAVYLMPSEQPGISLNLFGLMAMFLGALLILCSRDLRRRGTLVIWEAILCLGGFAIMAGYGLLGDRGAQVAVGLRWRLGEPLMDLLLDRREA